MEQQELFINEPITTHKHEFSESYREMMDTGRKGDYAEFFAVVWLWEQGYEVFLNAGHTGPVDMIATKDEETLLIDVKTFGDPKTKTGVTGRSRTEKQVALGVKLLLFNYETRTCRWMEHRK